MKLAVVLVLWAAVAAGLLAGWSGLERNAKLRSGALVAVLALALAHMLMYGVVAE